MSTNNAPPRGGLDLAFGTSFVTTMAVAVAPSFVSFGFLVWSRPDPHPFLATIVALVATAAAFAVGAKVWQTQPEAYGFSFADLMLRHWVRREWAEEKLIRNARLLGYDRQGRFVGKGEISPERQLFAAREIGAALDAKSSYTLNHSKRVEKHVREVAAALELAPEATEELATAAALHDIGNIRIPEHVIRKSGELTIEERSTIEGHVLLGALMAFEAGGEAVAQGLRHHHERWDGKGYPNGLKGEEVPLFARIIGIAEAYDAMTSTRPYRQSLTQDQAVTVLREEAGTQFDPKLVEVFASTLPEPLQIIERVPALAWAQRQLRELTILFRRVGGTAASAAASTLAIALILGTALLKPDVFPGGTDGGGGTRPDRRMIAGGNGQVRTTHDRITLAAVPDEGLYFGESVVGEGSAVPGDHSIEDVEVLGERIRIDGHQGGGAVDPGGDGGGRDGDRGGNDGGTDDGPTGHLPDDGNPDVVDGGGGGSGGGGGGSVTPPPGGGGDAGSDDGPTRPGKSGDAPGHNKGEGKGHGYGKDKDHGKPNKPGNGNGKGYGKDKDHGKPNNSGNGNGKDKDQGKRDDKPGSGASGNSDKKDGWAEAGNNGSDKSDGGSENSNGNGSDKENGADKGSPSSDASPGNSGGSESSNGNGAKDTGADKDSSSSDTSPGNSGGSSSASGSDPGNGPAKDNGPSSDASGSSSEKSNGSDNGNGSDKSNDAPSNNGNGGGKDTVGSDSASE